MKFEKLKKEIMKHLMFFGLLKFESERKYLGNDYKL